MSPVDAELCGAVGEARFLPSLDLLSHRHYFRLANKPEVSQAIGSEYCV